MGGKKSFISGNPAGSTNFIGVDNVELNARWQHNTVSTGPSRNPQKVIKLFNATKNLSVPIIFKDLFCQDPTTRSTYIKAFLSTLNLYY